jgi:hypothetical protein
MRQGSSETDGARIRREEVNSYLHWEAGEPPNGEETESDPVPDDQGERPG